MKMGDGDLASIKMNTYFFEKISKMCLSALQGLLLNTKGSKADLSFATLHRILQW